MQNGVGVRKVVEKKIRSVRRKLVPAVASGRHGHRDETSGAGAIDVTRSVSDHKNIGTLEGHAVTFHRAGMRHRTETVAVHMVVGEGAELEVVPDAVVRELQLRTSLDVAGQETEHAIRPRLERIKQRHDPGQNPPLPPRQFAGEVMDVAIEKIRDVLRRGRNRVRREHLAHDGTIRGTGEGNRGEIVIHPEPLVETEAQRMLARPSGKQQRPVDVEKDEFFPVRRHATTLIAAAPDVVPKLACPRHGVDFTAMPPERVLAVDPSLRGTGYAILESSAGKLRAITYGVVVNPPRIPAHLCLREIHQTLSDVAARHEPTAFAIEGIIYVQNVRTAIILGSTRGVALLVAASRGLAIHEYAPRLVKQAVVGRGGAQKDQVAFMIRALLGLKETPPPDAADALAIGVTHFNRQATAIR